MVNVLRRWSQPIMVVITVLVIVSFTYFGQQYHGTGSGSQTVITLNGKEISLDAFTRQSRRVGIYATLRGDYIRAVMPGALFRQEPNEIAVAKSFVLDHEMDQLGLTATDDEKIAALQKVPIFLDEEEKFDPNAYRMFKERVLGPQGFTENDFAEIFLAGEVRASKLLNLIGSTYTVSPAQVKEEILRESQRTEASVVAIRRDEFRKDVKVTEEEAKKRYEENKNFYMTAEQRKVRYAAFVLPAVADAKPLEGKERISKLQGLVNAAYTFREELVSTKGNFTELAKKHGATVAETKDFFTLDDVPQELEGSPQIGDAAFQLTKESPLSPHISVQKGTYVLELVEIKAPEQQKFEDVRAKIEAAITDEKALELAKTKAPEIRTKLAEAMKGGKSFADAAQSLTLKVEPQPAFGGFDRQMPGPYGDSVQDAARKLAPGEISEVVNAPSNDAFLIVHVDYRSTLDDKEVESRKESTKKQIEDGMPPFSMGARFGIFQAWLSERSRAAGVDALLTLKGGGA